jgi:hypothetical protein
LGIKEIGRFMTIQRWLSLLGYRKLILVLVAMLVASSPVMAASKVVVFYYDKQSQPITRLDRIAPMSDGLRAILAMYALQNGAGCDGGNENLTCALTDALKVGGQCSAQHLETGLGLVQDAISEHERLPGRCPPQHSVTRGSG